MKTAENANFTYAAIYSFSSEHEFKVNKALPFSHIAMEATWTHCVNVLETFNTFQYKIDKLDFCSYNLHICQFWYVDLAKVRLMFILLCPNIVHIYVLVTLRHRCVITREVAEESTRKICHHQQDVFISTIF